MMASPRRSKKKSNCKASGVDPNTAVRTAFQTTLLQWYQRHHRDLPWRKNRDPYGIAVSEFMLQQTQVATVLPYYERWLQCFPHWESLALAQEEQVIKAWEGLGYYRRARNLQKLAQAVVQLPQKELPPAIEELEKMPGIGPYTARAVGSIAFDLPVAVLDGNVIRVLTRVFAIQEDIKKPGTIKTLWSLAEKLAPTHDCGSYNQALMELGALLCTPRSPQCLLCPLSSICQAPEPEAFPVKTKTSLISQQETVAIIEKNSRWWCEKPNPGERLESLWRFPHFQENTMETTAAPPLAQFTYGITKYRIQLQAVQAHWKATPPLSSNSPSGWLSSQEIDALPFPSAHRKIWKILTSQTEALLTKR